MILLASGRMRARLHPCRSIPSGNYSPRTARNYMQTAAKGAGVTMARGKRKGPAGINSRQNFRTGIGPVFPTVALRGLCVLLVSV